MERVLKELVYAKGDTAYCSDEYYNDCKCFERVIHVLVSVSNENASSLTFLFLPFISLYTDT